MSLLFCDGFDNYTTLTDFWDAAGSDSGINLLGNARTGTGCLQIRSSAYGPQKSFGHMTHLLACTNWNSNSDGTVFDFLNLNVARFNGFMLSLSVAGDGSIRFDGSVSVIGQTAPGVVAFNSYNCIAVEIENFTTNTGIITCWVNGVQVFHQTGLKTTNASDTGSPSYVNAIQLMGPGGTPGHCFHDDFYLLDCSTPPHQTFLGALRLYAIAPTSDASVAWTPLAGGTNFSQVDEIPPDGDTSYVSSATVGQVDQYVYPLTGPPVGSSLIFVQHELDMKVDSGSRSVASDVAGVPSAVATALSNGYHIYPTPYDVNPATAVAFVAADFPLNAGPKVTA